MTAPATMIRKIDPGEAGRLAQFLCATFMVTYGQCSSAANIAVFLERNYSIAAQSAELNDPSRHCLVLIADGEWAGVAQLGLTDVDGRCTAYLSRFYFDARYHGLGLASQLLAKVIDRARAAGASALTLSAWKQAPQALRFYEKSGFRRIASADFVVGDEVLEDWLMQLDL